MQKHAKEKAFESWHHEYADSLFRFCFSKTSSREVALDLTQETFMRVWDTLHSDKHIENPRALIYTIARNLITDHYRKKKSDSLEALHEVGVEFGEGAQSENNAAYADALRVINTLSPVYREAVYLRYVEELKPREIAEITGESVNIISVRITRGMQELRTRLENGTKT